jgi:hypothetical protein
LYSRRGEYDSAARCLLNGPFKFHDCALTLIERVKPILFELTKRSWTNEETVIASINTTSHLSVFGAGSVSSLKAFLQAVINKLPSNYKTQKTMILTWVIDIFLSELFRSKMNGETAISEGKSRIL